MYVYIYIYIYTYLLNQIVSAATEADRDQLAGELEARPVVFEKLIHILYMYVCIYIYIYIYVQQRHGHGGDGLGYIDMYYR